MGNTHACCSVDSAAPKDSVKVAAAHHRALPELLDPAAAHTAAGLITTPPPTIAEQEEFRLRIEGSGIRIRVVIADGKKIYCQLRWLPREDALVMTCEANNHFHVRRMGLDELITVIWGRRELGRVATRAKIVDDPTCVALHLASNTCIPICLDNEKDKACFVTLIDRLKSRTSEQSLQDSNQNRPSELLPPPTDSFQ